MSSWAEVLDDMELRVADAERLLAAGGPPPPTFALPGGLGPLPPELRRRAEAVLEATVDAQRRVEQRFWVMAEALRRDPRDASPAAAYIDRRV